MKQNSRRRLYHTFIRHTYGSNYYPWQKLTAGFYRISAQNIQRSVRFAVISDLHQTVYGKHQSELLKLIQQGKPDAVLMPGDMMESADAHADTALLLHTLAGRYPCFYAAGNHEFYTREPQKIKSRIASYGICVLSGSRQRHMFNSQPVIIGGLDDCSVGRAEWRRQLAAVSCPDTDAFSILLSHRPEFTAAYQTSGFQLVVCGHAHGGQWRFPFLPNGLAAPGQGLFPRYTGGLYRLDGNTLLVSRGLARNILPRFGNPPEVVFITVTPPKSR